MTPSLGPLVQSYFMDHLPVQKGLRVGSIRSYRDTIRLFLCFVSGQRRRSISSLNLDDLTFERVLAFLKHFEQERRNSVRTRNQRRAALNTFFAYVAVRVPEMLAACQQVAAIPVENLAARYPLPRARGGNRDYSVPCHGTVASRCATALYCFFCTTPAPGSRRPPIFASSISSSSHRRRFAFMARVISGASVRCGMRPSGISSGSSPSRVRHRMSQSFARGAASPSRVSGSTR